MIVTCKKEVPFRWIATVAVPWLSYNFNYGVMGAAFIFSLKKFVENPAGLTFILSLPGFVSILLGPAVNFTSDRIWTRFGRRKPFLVTAWAGMAIAFVLMPLMPNFWALLAAFIFYNMCNDVGGPWGPMEPLSQEVVPPHQRGRSVGVMQWYSNFATMVFYFLVLGRFDDVTFMAGVPLVGEKVIFWTAGLLIFTVLIVVSLGIREMNQKSPLQGQRLNLKTFVGGILDRELWPVYMLSFGGQMLGAGLGALGNLLYTDQWNYTKQEMGINVVIGGIINMFVIVFLAVIADRLNRMRTYQTLICVALAIKLSYFCYITFVLPDQRPTLVELVVFGEMLSIIGMLTGMVAMPLVYDYVTRNKMGTYLAGGGLLGRVTGLVTLNGVGLFIWGYATLFQPPAGDMVRVVLHEETQKTEVSAALRSAAWTSPQNGSAAAASDLHAKAWFSTGMVLDKGRCWEIRLRDKDSEQLAAKKELLNKESSPLLAQVKMLRDAADALKSRGEPEAAERKRADEKEALANQLLGQAKDINSTLASRARNLQDQIARIFGDRLLVDGEQVLGAGMREALQVEMPTAQRPDGRRLEKILADLRVSRPEIIDLRPMKRQSGYGLVLSALLPPDTNEENFAGDLQADLERVAAVRDPNLIGPGTVALGRSRQPALALDLMIIEEPLDTHISPIMRVTNGILALFDSAPAPDRRLAALARNLRLTGETDHVRVCPGPNKAISVITILRPDAAKSGALDDPVARRLQQFLSPAQDARVLAQARAFYDRIETAAATKRITVARPFVAAAYAPLKYDYMCGYIWMFLLGLVGLGITFVFTHFEKKGLIRKLGVEEEAAS
jgi:Na+/melibiose symporter-like transporter